VRGKPSAKKKDEDKTHGEAQVTASQVIHGRTKDDRIAKIQALIGQADKAFGKGALTTLRGQFASRTIEGIGIISTGSLAIDAATGIGGIPRGRVTEIYGPEAGGKTTLTLHIIAEAQKAGGVCAFIDAEHALDPAYAASLGVDLEQLILNQPDNGEQGLQLVDLLVSSGNVDLVVIDSVSALVPRAELEGEMGDAQPGMQARLMSQALRKLTGRIHTSNCSVVFINQLRMKIGVTFGSPETTSGGNALKFYASLRMDVRRIGSLTRGEDRIGNKVKVLMAKNKLAPPHKQCEVDIIFGEGISIYGETIDLGVAKEFIAREGAWYSYGENRLGQGRENAMKNLRNNPVMFDEIRGKLRACLNL